MRKIVVALLVAVILGVSASAWAADKEERIVIMNEAKLPWELNTWLVKTVCAEGKVFLVSYVLGQAAGASVSAVQVMEEKDGKTVPMKCDPGKYKTEE
ncbi:MAG: hypothetical protein KKA60_12925 [Proteobacteria bacterium]|nr:hypothetical protein [Pseudomonadota bacterium]